MRRIPLCRHMCSMKEAIMRIRLVVPLLSALVALFAAMPASANDCGAANAAGAANACDACSYPAYKMRTRTKYQLVYDTVVEKRWHTCYQTVEETQMKPV